MIDLADVIRMKQDEIRGRPRDWRDRFANWRETTTIDKVDIAYMAANFVLRVIAIIAVWMIITA